MGDSGSTLTRGWTRLKDRRGVFGDYMVQGFELEHPTGQKGWYVSAWPGRDPIHNFWVEGSVFFFVRLHIGESLADRTCIELFNQATEIKPALKDAVVAAIGLWESEGA